MSIYRFMPHNRAIVFTKINLASLRRKLTLSFLKLHRPRKQLHPFRSLSLFATLTPRELRVLDGMLHYRNFQAGEVIFDEGEEGQALYVVLTGHVQILRVKGKEIEPIAEIGSGNFFGDQALLDNSPRSAQARALDNCELAVFFRADFTSLLDTHAVIGYKISLELARHMSRRLRAWMSGTHPSEAV